MTFGTAMECQELTFDGSKKLIESLAALSPTARLEAIEKLLRSSSREIRGRTLRVGAAVLSDDQLTAYLRDEADDVLRNAGLEILKIRGGRAFPLALSLLKDNDPDIVLQAVQILDNLKDLRALEHLCSILRHNDPNVVQAAIIAIGHLGDARAIPELLPFLSADPWLQMADVQALGDLRSPVTVRPLGKLLTDFMVGSLAAEALARIGGIAAFRTLAKYWLKFRDQLDQEIMLGLLSHVVEGLIKNPPTFPGLRESLALYLDDPSDKVRASAARCLLAMGPGLEDEKAVRALAYMYDSQIIPACLTRRKDLIPYLLVKNGVLRDWGFQLAASFPKSIPITVLCEAINSFELRESLESVVSALSRIKDRILAPAILRLYLRTPIASRPLLNHLLHLYRKQIGTLLTSPYVNVDNETRIVVSALLGASAKLIVSEILNHSEDSRIGIISQITDRKAILKRLPWSKWLQNEPRIYAAVAAEVAVRAGLRELLPLLRQILISDPVPRIISAVGDLGDRESLPILISHLSRATPLVKVLILENLGRVGGPEARKALREAAVSPEAKESRVAYKALSRCAAEEDVVFFRNAVTNPDWYVRLSCTEVLGRYPCPENLTALAGLASDPNALVAQRAISFPDSWRR